MDMNSDQQTHPEIECSIIIPNLHSPIIDRTIESILAQKTRHTYEIIVVGMDKFGLVEKYPQVQFIKTKEPTPPGTARNIGASASTGDYLIFIDADCIAESNWLDTHLQCHQHHNDILLVGGGVRFDKNNYFTLSDNISSFHEYMLHIVSGRKTILPTLNLSLPKRIWETLNGFISSQTGEDIDFTFRANLKGFVLLFEPAAVVTHMPNRRTFKQILSHSFLFGVNSIKANPRYWEDLKINNLFQNWFISLILSPAVSMVVLLRIIFIEKIPLKYWYTFPMIYILKLAWCLGFVKRLKKTRKKSEQK